MSGEVDPNWPPPQPEARSNLDWTPPPYDRSVGIEPNWPPPMPQVGAGATAPPTAISSPSPTQSPTRASIGNRQVLVWSLAVLAGVACVGLGAVITLALTTRERTA